MYMQNLCVCVWGGGGGGGRLQARIDTHAKWPEVVFISSISGEKGITA